VFVLGCQPLDPASLDASDHLRARITAPTLKPVAPLVMVFGSHLGKSARVLGRERLVPGAQERLRHPGAQMYGFADGTWQARYSDESCSASCPNCRPTGGWVVATLKLQGQALRATRAQGQEDAPEWLTAAHAR